MKRASFFPSPEPPFFPVLTLCILLFSFLLRESLGMDDPDFLACSVPKNCGDGQNITFPFYIEGKQESYCGLPGFQMSCNSNGHAILDISGDNYIVHEIFYRNHTLRVSNAYFSNSDPDCVPLIKDTALPNLKFELTPGQTNLLFLYNCSNSSLLHGLLRVDNRCYGENRTSLVVVSPDENQNLGEASGPCPSRVAVPVEAYEGTSEGLRGALENGFWLKWKGPDCSICEESGGVCGFDNFTFGSRCFCADGPHVSRCGPGQFSLSTLLLS